MYKNRIYHCKKCGKEIRTNLFLKECPECKNEDLLIEVKNRMKMTLNR